MRELDSGEGPLKTEIDRDEWQSINTHTQRDVGDEEDKSIGV